MRFVASEYFRKNDSDQYLLFGDTHNLPPSLPLSDKSTTPNMLWAKFGNNLNIKESISSLSLKYGQLQPPKYDQI